MRTTLYTLFLLIFSLLGIYTANGQCPPITPFCQDLNTSFMPDVCMVEVWAKDFISKINNRETDIEDFFISFHPTELVMSQIFRSEDGDEQMITIYIGNGCDTTSCTVTLNINDNTGMCSICPFEVNPWCGQAVITCSGLEGGSFVAAIMDTRKNSDAPRGDNWTEPQTEGADVLDFVRPEGWTLGSIGQVFGTAISPVDGSIFFAASDVYALDFKLYASQIDPAFLRGETPPTCPGPAGAAGIYKTSFDNNSIVSFVTTSTPYLTSVQAINGTQIPNSGNEVECTATDITDRDPIGNGIGNIAYDYRSDHLYASNLEDGKIYGINAQSGLIDFIYDPFDPYSNHMNTGMVRSDERVWGVQIMNCGVQTELFFARESLEANGGNRDKEIYSILIGGDGNFIGAEELEFVFPFGRQEKITDLAFSSDCNKILVTERGHPHKSQVHEYELVGGNWTQTQQFFVGINAPDDPTQPDGNILGTSAAGGVTYGAEEDNCVIDNTCDGTVWSTVNCGSPTALGSGCSIYGAEGIDAGGNQLETNNDTDIFVSFSENIAQPSDFKTNIGDIEIFNCCCPSQEGRNVIASTTGIIAGIIVTAQDVTLKDTEVSIAGETSEQMIMSDELGEYEFRRAVMHEDYMIQPSKNGSASDGLTTLDILKVQRHILGIEQLESPYQMIAADVNNSQSVSVTDLLEMRKVILGIQDHFNQKPVWDFVAAHKPMDEYNPHTYDSYRAIHDLSESILDADFIAIKSGDVNGDNSAERLSEVRTSAKMEASLRELGDITIMDVYSKGIGQISGFQMSINVQSVNSKIESLQLQLGDSNSHLSGEELHISWNAESARHIDETIPLFSILILDSKANPILGDDMKAEIYDHNLVAYRLDLQVLEQELRSDIELSPNPSSDQAKLRFALPADQTVAIEIFSLDGRFLYRKRINGLRGINEVTIDHNEIGTEESSLSIVRITGNAVNLQTKMLTLR